MVFKYDRSFIHRLIQKLNDVNVDIKPIFILSCCRCGKCDGQCGPSNGCPCNACVELVGYVVKDGKAVKQ